MKNRFLAALILCATGSYAMPMPSSARSMVPSEIQQLIGVDYRALDEMPAVIRKNRTSTVEALQNSGVDKYDIPAFLRKQAD